MIQFIDQLQDISGKRILVRVDYNCPLNKDGTVADNTRIRESIPTLRHLLGKGARLVLCSHLGRPKGKDPSSSMVPIGEELARLLGLAVMVPDESPGEKDLGRLVSVYQNDEVVLLENLRWSTDEEANSLTFAERLRSLADYYVNDAFGSCHRAHASIDQLPRLFGKKAYAGFLIKKELEYLGKLLHDPGKPFTLLVGGAKVSDKIGTLEVLVPKANYLIVGGAMAYTFLKAKGLEVGKSRVEKDHIRTAEKIIELARMHSVELLLPIDHLVADSLDATSAQTVDEIPHDKLALDIGPKTILAFKKAIEKSATVFWNGPMGLFESKTFSEGTSTIARTLANATCSTIVGGGDTASAVAQFGVADRMTHVSTGGGASLEFLELQGKIPGLLALGY